MGNAYPGVLYPTLWETLFYEHLDVRVMLSEHDYVTQRSDMTQGLEPMKYTYRVGTKGLGTR